MYYKVFICILASINFCETYRMLLAFPMPFKSHHILGKSLINLLLKAGHEVTYITPMSVANSKNLSQIIINQDSFEGPNLTTMDLTPRTFEVVFNTVFNATCKVLTDEHVQHFMQDTTQTFDLVIAEWTFNDLYSGFSALFNCPLIWFFTFHNDYEMLRLIHDIPNPTLVSNTRTNNVPVLNFKQRIEELLFYVTFEAWTYFHRDPLETTAYAELFGPFIVKRGRTLPSYEKVRYSASLALVNSHLTIRDCPVMPQNLKLVGGFHISETSEPLSQELLSVMESSGNGVILFSLGSFLKAEDLSSNTKKDLVEMFSELNYTVLWKIDEHLKDLPPNVRTFSWIPIQRVLAHPKCVLFITHGGILSLTESVHFGVPIVGIPVFGDQTANVKTIVKRGVARMVQMSPKLADTLKEAIEDVLSDPKYKENMKTLSSLYHDRLLSPGSDLVYWVEHVVATRGAPHLRSPALLLSWYQKYYVDLITALLLFIISFIFFVNKIFVCIFGNNDTFVLKNSKSC